MRWSCLGKPPRRSRQTTSPDGNGTGVPKLPDNRSTSFPLADRLTFHLGDQLRRTDAQSLRELLRHENRRHPEAALPSSLPRRRMEKWSCCWVPKTWSAVAARPSASSTQSNRRRSKPDSTGRASNPRVPPRGIAGRVAHATYRRFVVMRNHSAVYRRCLRVQVRHQVAADLTTRGSLRDACRSRDLAAIG